MLQALQTEVAELKDQRLRALAEVENIRRRAEKEKSEASQYAVSRFARDMLGIADNFARALAACPPDWTPAAQVVGHAMTQCDRRNRMSDLFFHSRLQMLITAGKIAARGPRESMRGYEVMRVGGGS